MKEVVNRHIAMLREPLWEFEIQLKAFALTRCNGLLAAAPGLCCHRNWRFSWNQLMPKSRRLEVPVQVALRLD